LSIKSKRFWEGGEGRGEQPKKQTQNVQLTLKPRNYLPKIKKIPKLSKRIKGPP